MWTDIAPGSSSVSPPRRPKKNSWSSGVALKSRWLVSYLRGAMKKSSLSTRSDRQSTTERRIPIKSHGEQLTCSSSTQPICMMTNTTIVNSNPKLLFAKGHRAPPPSWLRLAKLTKRRQDRQGLTAWRRLSTVEGERRVEREPMFTTLEWPG